MIRISPEGRSIVAEKKRLLPILVAVLIGFAMVPMMAASAYASDTVVTVDRVNYALNDDDMTAAVTGHVGTLPEDITILDMVEHEGAEYTVTRIEKEAFRQTEELESVMFMPGSKLELIGADAFLGCSNLRDITIPAGVKEIGITAFGDAGLKSITFLKGSQLETIGDFAFMSCNNLKHITIPASTIVIGEDAFRSSGLESISIEGPSRLEVIDDQAFINCEHLASIMLPASVKEIGHDAFELRASLHEIHYLGTRQEWDRIRKDDNWSGAAVHFIKHRITKATPETYGEEKTYCPECEQYNTKTTIEKPERFLLSAASYAYDGSEKTPDVTVTDSSDGVIDASNYDVTYSGNVDVGTATATVTFKGDYYTGSKDLTFDINAKAITPAVTLSASSYTYNGKVKTPDVTVKDGTKALIKDTDYTVTYASGRKNAGRYKVTVKMKGNYAGSSVKTFTINKAANPLKITAKTATVKYSKLKKANQKLGVTKVISFRNKGQGTKAYAKASGNKKITIAKKTGKVTVKKGLKKGTYKVKVKVKAAGTGNYKPSAWKTVTLKIRVQ